MADDFTFDHVNYIFGNVGCLVGDSLKVPGYRYQVNKLRNTIWVIAHILLNIQIHLAVHGVHFVVGSTNVTREVGIGIDKLFLSIS